MRALSGQTQSDREQAAGSAAVVGMLLGALGGLLIGVLLGWIFWGTA